MFGLGQDSAVPEILCPLLMPSGVPALWGLSKERERQRYRMFLK